jgi:ATP/ADP translocase
VPYIRIFFKKKKGKEGFASICVCVCVGWMILFHYNNNNNNNKKYVKKEKKKKKKKREKGNIHKRLWTRGKVCKDKKED